MHLRFDLLFEHYFAALEDFLNVRTQLAGVRINNREFLLNPESKGVLLGAHSGRECLSKITSCHPEWGSQASCLTRRPGCQPGEDYSIFSAGKLRASREAVAYPSKSPNEYRVTAAWSNLPQLKLSRPGTCSRALRIAISEIASTTHSKLGCPIHAASQSGAGLQKSIATGTPSRMANSTVFRS